MRKKIVIVGLVVFVIGIVLLFVGAPFHLMSEEVCEDYLIVESCYDIYPYSGIGTVVQLLGIFMIVTGIVLIIIGLCLKAVISEVPEAKPQDAQESEHS